MKHHQIEWIELFKTIAVLLLMVMLVCLCIIYMLSFQNTGGYTFTKDTMQALGGESVKYQYADHRKPMYVSPKLIGFSAKEKGDNIGFYTLGGENIEIYTSLFPFYEKLFAEGQMEKLSVEEGEQFFSEGMKKDHIYVVYENDLPKSLIYAMMGKDTMLPSVSGEYIRELMILPDIHLYDGVSSVPSGMKVYTSIYSFYAVAKDSDGNYYRYTTDFRPNAASDVSFNTNYYLTYTMAEDYFSYSYAGELLQDDYFIRQNISEKVTALTVIPEAYMRKSKLSMTAAAPDSAKTSALLAALMMNPEQVTSFTDPDGIQFYYEEGRNVSISPAGHLEYTAYGEEGLPLAELFEYHASGEAYDLLDYLGASLLLARSLESTGGTENPCSLYLRGVYTDGNAVTISLGYTADGLPVYLDGDSEILSFEFDAGMLRRVSYDLKHLHKTSEKQINQDLLWMLRFSILKHEERYEYAYGYLLGEGEQRSAEYLAKKP